MTQNDREERLAADVAAAVAGCPEAEQLQAYHDGALSRELREQISKHVAECTACAAALEFLDSGAVEPPAVEVPDEVERRSEELVGALRRGTPVRRRQGWIGILRVAALIVFAAAVGLFALQRLGMDRLEDDLGDYRGGQPLDLLDPVGRVAEPPTSMRWGIDPVARSYRVILFDEAMNEVWTRKTGTAEGLLALDTEAVAAMSPGSGYAWQVESLDAVGAVIGRSAAGHFEVAGEPPH